MIFGEVILAHIAMNHHNQIKRPSQDKGIGEL